MCTTLVDDTTPRPTWDSFDPHVLLTVRATSKKALQPKDFVPEQVKQRIARRRRETLKWVEADDGSFSVQADDQALAYLTQAEWGAANMRLMAHLLKVGDLQRARVEDYMAYTVSIYELECRYEWISVLEYDARYREQQAEHGYQWGAPARHLESILLLPRQRDSQSSQVSQGHTRYGKRTGGGASAGRPVGMPNEDPTRGGHNEGGLVQGAAPARRIKTTWPCLERLRR